MAADERRPGYLSPPFAESRDRVTLLYPELRALGLETHIAELAVQGYTILPPEKVGPLSYIDQLHDAIVAISERRTGVKPDVAAGSTHRAQEHPLGQFMRYVLFDDPVFEPLLTNPPILGLITYLVGFDAILSLYDAMLKGPGGSALRLHNDNGDLTTQVYPDRPQTANVNLLLRDYEADSGPIAFLPGSHGFRRQPTQQEMRELPASGEMVPVIAPKGSAVIWPANTWHVALPREAPGLRATILLDFCRGHLQPQSPFRADVTDEMVARNPPRFAQLMHLHGAFPFRQEDIDAERTAKGAARHSLFDCHPLWKEHFAIRKDDRLDDDDKPVLNRGRRRHADAGADRRRNTRAGRR